MSNNCSTTIQIQAGQLTIDVDHARRPLDELLAFASRQNHKRGYLFVSKVLGKHWPVSPQQMRATYDELASLTRPGPITYVVGMAETATGLGAGVADSLSRLQPDAVYYQHTTRHLLDQPLWLSLDEAHSHAVDHLLYQPQADCLSGISAAERLVLVDDEISTGRTLKLLVERLLPRLPALREIVIVSLVSWLDDEKRAPYLDLPHPVRFISLLDGRFSFSPDPTNQTRLPDDVDADSCTLPSRTDLGRCGLRMPYQGPLPDISSHPAMTIIGNGEHLYLPFLVAEQQARNGSDVLFQSTTRSPIQLGDAITSKAAFAIDERPVRHYAYNLADQNRQLSLLLEDDQQYAAHGLAQTLAQHALYQPPAQQMDAKQPEQVTTHVE